MENFWELKKEPVWMGKQKQKIYQVRNSDISWQ